MLSSSTHKVCFDIGGKPAIYRLLENLHAAGIRTHVIVVGAMAGQVVETVGKRFPEAVFAYQHEQKGTGHAAQVGARVLQRLGHTDPVLVTMGDKLLGPSAVTGLTAHSKRTEADLCFLTAPRTPNDTAGRVLTDRNRQILGNFEVFDIQRARWFDDLDKLCRRRKTIASKQLLATGRKRFPSEKKLRLAGGDLLALAEASDQIPVEAIRGLLPDRPGSLRVGGRWITGERVEKQARTVNVSVYLYRAEALYESLGHITPDNAQGEYYLTDTIDFLANTVDERGAYRFRVHELPLEDPHAVMAFNSPDELLAIEDHLHRHAVAASAARTAAVRDPRQFKPLGKWRSILEKVPAGLRRRLAEIYGPDDSRMDKRLSIYRSVLARFAKRFGNDREVCIVRAPGSINLMGRHVDHQGGHVNVMAIDREVVMVAGDRDDDLVRLTNLKARDFPSREFGISRLLGDFNWDDWLSFVDSPQVRRLVRESAGDWSDYVKAVVLRIQQRYHDVRLHGMDCAVAGDIPIAAGLSSSSALVVATAHAALAINHAEVEGRQFVDLCEEGEWFVGARGGMADHAAIRFGRRGSVAHVRFFPFEVERNVALPGDLRVIIANSQIPPAAGSGTRNQVNQRVASYEIGLRLLRGGFREFEPLLAHLRDVSTARLGVKLSQIYTMVRQLPLAITRTRLRQILSESTRADLDDLWTSHPDPGDYAVRQVVMYGLAECQRARIAADLLQRGDPGTFGRLMNISHDGDRVLRFDADGNGRPHAPAVADADLHALIEDLTSEEPDRVAGAQLHLQPGGYACSLPEIDRMVDAVVGLPGVHGAQLSGAGLGGCIMVLADADAAPAVERTLRQVYYRPGGLVPQVSVCQPVEGSGLLTV